MISAKQNTALGGWGLEAISKQFCGPNCNLRDIDVDFYRLGKDMLVSFWDMGVALNSDHKLYSLINQALFKEEDRIRGALTA